MHNPHCRSAACFACLIPKPASLLTGTGEFKISPDTKIFSQTNSDEVTAVAGLLVAYLQQVSGNKTAGAGADQSAGNIQLMLNSDASLGEEGYELSITPDALGLSAHHPAGLFYESDSLPTSPCESHRDYQPACRYDT
jgi:hexosaminidase